MLWQLDARSIFAVEVEAQSNYAVAVERAVSIYSTYDARSIFAGADVARSILAVEVDARSNFY